ARSERTGRPVRSDTSAVAIVTPAEGPSFGMAPAGTWTCTSERSQNSGSMPSSPACERTHDSAACTDSFMTSPSWPVRVSVRAPRIRVASTNSTSPPAGVQAVVPRLLGHEMLLCDGHLLLLGVAGEVDDLHPVPQRGRHRVDDVRGGDEEYPREVERHVQIVVAEGGVLLRVQHLEQGR